MTTPRIQTVGAASCRPHPAPRYDVFLSYRHAPADTAAAVKAMAFLESYRPPEFQDARVAQPRRVFRDTEELPVSSALSAAIEEALREARSLLVVCSERTPESAWVDREVRTFAELGKGADVYALLIDGTPETAFPPSLKEIPGIAERTLDAREGPEGDTALPPSKSGRLQAAPTKNTRRGGACPARIRRGGIVYHAEDTSQGPTHGGDCPTRIRRGGILPPAIRSIGPARDRLNDALLRLAAHIWDVDEDLLRAQEYRRRTKTLARSAGVAAAAFACVLAVSLSLWAKADAARDRALSEQAATMDMLQALTYDLPARLANLSGAHELLSETLEQNVQAIDGILAITPDPAAAERARAANLTRLAETWWTLGEPDKALDANRAAADIYKKYATADSEIDTGNSAETAAYATSLSALGARLSEAGRADEAAETLAQAVAVAETAAASTDAKPTAANGASAATPDPAAALPLCLQNFAAHQIRTGDYAAAEETLLRCLETLGEQPEASDAGATGASSASPNAETSDRSTSPLLQRTLIDAYGNLSTVCAMGARYEEARAWADRRLAAAEALYEDAPSYASRESLAAAWSSLADAAGLAGDDADAEAAYQKSIETWQPLAADAQNTDARTRVAVVGENYGAFLNVRGRYDEAAEAYAAALAILTENTALPSALPAAESPSASGTPPTTGNPPASADAADAAAKAGTPPARQAAVARLWYNIAENDLDAGRTQDARAAYDTCLALYAPVAEALGPYHFSEYLARRAYYKLLFDRDPADALADAERAVSLAEDASFPRYMLAYALLYADDPRAPEELEALVARGPTELANLREDLATQTRLGLTPNLPEPLKTKLGLN